MKHRTYRWLAAFGALLVVTLMLVSAAGLPAAARQDPRVELQVWDEMAQAGQVDVLITVGSPANLASAYRLADKEERGAWVYETLRQEALTTQAPLVRALAAEGAPFRQFWITNAVQARVDADALARVLKVPSVHSVISNAPVLIDGPVLEPSAAEAEAPIPWGAQRVQAPWAWAQGITGAGVVISGQDTGYDWDHPALKASYRGYDAAADTVDHNYNWHDSIHSDVPPSDSGNPCGYNSPQPCDDQRHGTHTMGTMTGNDLAATDPAWPAGAAHAVGVAPGARWIGCRNMDNGWGRPSTYIECFEWFTAPYPLGGDPMTEGDPGKAPDIVNNSWGCPPDEGCTPAQLGAIEPAVNAADAAGILVVASAGNSGPSCSSVDDPAAIYPRTFAVGATASSDGIAGFSSRGAVTYQNQTYQKPDIAAPGSSVYSTVPGSSYDYMSGTSMAAPHTAGVAALLLSAQPALAGQTDLIKAILQRTADPVPNFTCGASDGGVPNNVYGWGIVNARNAIESLSQAATLRGVVSSDSGPLAGVEVKLLDKDGGVVATTTTAGDGAYQIEAPWGRYALQALAEGYEPGSVSPVLLVGGRTTTQDLTLEADPDFVIRHFLPLLRQNLP